MQFGSVCSDVLYVHIERCSRSGRRGIVHDYLDSPPVAAKSIQTRPGVAIPRTRSTATINGQIPTEAGVYVINRPFAALESEDGPLWEGGAELRQFVGVATGARVALRVVCLRVILVEADGSPSRRNTSRRPMAEKRAVFGVHAQHPSYSMATRKRSYILATGYGSGLQATCG